MMNLILIGKTRSGKSSTGNSIIGKEEFYSSDASSLEEISKPIKKINSSGKFEVSVTDGLDVCDCGEKADFIPIEHALELSKEGIDGFLIAVKYGERFDADYRKVIEITKQIFGNDVIEKFGILVLTSGDHFKHDVKKKSEQYEVRDWFEKQTGGLKDLYCECSRRCVLFDNRTENTSEKEEQIKNLITIVSRLTKNNNTGYTWKHYEQAKHLRKGLTMSKLSVQKKRECDDFIRNIRIQTEYALKNINVDELKTIKKELEDKLKENNCTFRKHSQYSIEINNTLQTELLSVDNKIRFLTEGNSKKSKTQSATRVSPNKRNHNNEPSSVRKTNTEEKCMISSKSSKRHEDKQMEYVVRKQYQIKEQSENFKKHETSMDKEGATSDDFSLKIKLKEIKRKENELLNMYSEIVLSFENCEYENQPNVMKELKEKIVGLTKYRKN